MSIHLDYGNTRLLHPSDDFLEQKSLRSPDFDFGAWLSTAEFNGGISIKHLFSSKLNEEAKRYVGTNNTIYQPHLYLNANYHLDLSSTLSLDPALLYRRVFSAEPLLLNTISIGTQLGYKNTLFAGINYVSGEYYTPLEYPVKLKIKDKYSFYGSYGRSQNTYFREPPKSYNVGLNVNI